MVQVLKSLPRRRAHLAVGIVAGVALSITLRFCVSEARIHLQTKGRDGTVVQIEKFARLRPVLVAQQEVGYISDSPSSTIFYQARYALAPAKLMFSQEPLLLVGWFENPSNASTVVSNLNLIVMRDLGNGVCLLRKRAP